MASSGSITGSWSGGSMRLRCDWEVISQDASNLTSTVQVQYIAQRRYTNTTTNKTNAPWTQNVGGVASSGNKTFNISSTTVNTDYVYRTDTVTVQHASDGTANITISGTINLSGTSAGTGSFSGTAELPRIATTPPTVNSLTVSDTTSAYSTVGQYVATKSVLRLTATATAGDAPIASYSFYRNGTLLSTVSTSATSASFTATYTLGAGSYTYSVVVTDSYGRSVSYTASAITVVAYSLPTVSPTTFRSNSSGTADESGTYVSCSATWTYAAVGSNSASCTVTVESTGYALSQGVARVLGGSLDPNTEYTITYTVTDSLGSTAIAYYVLRTSFKNFQLYPDKTVGGEAFGESAQLGKHIVKNPATFRSYIESDGGINLSNLHSYTCGSATDLATAINAEYSKLVNGSIGWMRVIHTVGFSPWGGGTWLIQIWRVSSTYGCAFAMSYHQNDGARFLSSSFWNGAWTNWQ